MRVGVYARFSSTKQSDGSTIEVQLEACRKTLPTSATVVEYIDRARSGCTLAGRDALRQLSDDAATGKLDRVLVYKYDRLGRSQAEVATLIQDLEDAGVTVESATESDDPFARGMYLVISEEYSRQLAQRTYAGCVKAAESGRVGGPAPYGYMRDAEGQLVTHPETAPIARRIFEDYTRRGMSAKAIAQALNAENIPSARGGEWRGSAILEILKNETYAGRLVFNKRKFRRDRSTGRRVYTVRPKEEWMVQDRPDLALVSPDVWKLAQARRATRAQPGARRRTYALSGLVECPLCGSRFVASRSTNAKGSYTYFACSSRLNGGKCENNFRFREDLVVAEIIRQATAKVLEGDTVEALKAEITCQATERLAGSSRRRKEALAEIVALDKKIIAVQEQIIDERIHGNARDVAAWSTRLRAFEADRQRLEAEARDLADTVTVDHKRVSRLVEEAIERHRRGLAAPRKPELTRETLRQLIGRIFAHPNKHLTTCTRPGNLIHEVAGSRIQVVAGAGFEPATFGL